MVILPRVPESPYEGCVCWVTSTFDVVVGGRPKQVRDMDASTCMFAHTNHTTFRKAEYQLSSNSFKAAISHLYALRSWGKAPLPVLPRAQGTSVDKVARHYSSNVMFVSGLPKTCSRLASIAIAHHIACTLHKYFILMCAWWGEAWTRIPDGSLAIGTTLQNMSTSGLI